MFHCLIILSVKSCFLVFRWNPKLTCVHLVQSLKATEKSLAPPSSFPPARCQDLPQVFSSPCLQVPALSASHTWCCAMESSTPDGSSSVLSNKEGSPSLTCQQTFSLCCHKAALPAHSQFTDSLLISYSPVEHSPLLNLVRILRSVLQPVGAPSKGGTISWWHKLLLTVYMACKLHPVIQVINESDQYWPQQSARGYTTIELPPTGLCATD